MSRGIEPGEITPSTSRTDGYRYVSPEELLAVGAQLAHEKKSFLDLEDEPYASPEALASLFKALANARRIETVQILEQGPARIADIAAMLEEPINHLIRHLRVLEQTQVVLRHQKVYALNPAIEPLLKAAVCHILSPHN